MCAWHETSWLMRQEKIHSLPEDIFCEPENRLSICQTRSKIMGCTYIASSRWDLGQNFYMLLVSATRIDSSW